ncbi:hypothetical protein LTR53_004542 [Teratosphaeriaceae sp. CCFEE 6253]|nr:hypothetical protein LTR53_004542 [Teratosphaeriaceae sp. CCFEE 6253]
MAASRGEADVVPHMSDAQQAIGGAAVELEALPSSSVSASGAHPYPTEGVDPGSSMAHSSEMPPSSTSAAAIASEALPSTSHPSPPSNPTKPDLSTTTATGEPDHAPLTRLQTEYLGPAVDSISTTIPVPNPSSTPSTGPTLHINLMLTTGAKHPYTLSEKYLTSRGAVPAGTGKADFNPMGLTGYKLKELIWTDWRREWEPRPVEPGRIRLICMGKMVEDGKMLKDYAFALDRPNIVHMTVKPADFDDPEEGTQKHAGKGGSIRVRDPGEGGAGCRCVIL